MLQTEYTPALAGQSITDLESGTLPSDAWLHIRKQLRLSERELRIAQEIFVHPELQSNALAAALAESPEFVYRTIQRIYVKLRIGSRVELISRIRSEYKNFMADQAWHAGY